MNRIIVLMVLVTAFAKAELSRAQKVEKEYRIDEVAVPQVARDFIASFDVSRKIKWIQEVSDEGTSIEAKFKSSGTRYSIEFTESGMLEDLEVLVKMGDIGKIIRKNIENYLDTTFDYYKVEKVQAQYIDTPERILQWRATDKKLRSLRPKYEIVLKARNSGSSAKRFEFLFDEEGIFIKKEQIIKRNDNILRF
ncbi:hypothetical protein EAX61_02500 [Dokdonia sinensis]|uniref:Uncharacterized protein n=1 Tax=Dokdonia sinensis TaxID=2479847 RepID=A0A3M0GEW7_9FLAO|nr:hypothetical protein [Dokdonia sinensis]RMB63280.1 hypothetical protein EAX61_02500 [Dokdonia sinensis]